MLKMSSIQHKAKLNMLFHIGFRSALFTVLWHIEQVYPVFCDKHLNDFWVTAPVFLLHQQQPWEALMNNVCLFHSLEIQLFPIFLPVPELCSFWEDSEHKILSGMPFE